jgi:anion-transporting  ArsA/GET3 family ATPase
MRESTLGGNRNIKNLLELFGIGAGIITYQQYFNERKNKDLKEILSDKDDIIKNLNKANESYNNNIYMLENEKNQLNDKNEDMQDFIRRSLDKFVNILNETKNSLNEEKDIIENLSKKEIDDNNISDYQKLYMESQVKNETNIENIQKVVNDINNEYQNLNFISNFSLSDYYKFLETLTVEKLGALTVLIFSGVIFSGCINIISIYFGEYLIIKYKIDERYPKLAKFIQLRRTLQRYYLIYSLSIIMFSSVFLIVVCFIEVFLS